jgi:hypothetical protein
MPQLLLLHWHPAVLAAGVAKRLAIKAAVVEHVILNGLLAAQLHLIQNQQMQRDAQYCM